MNRFLSIDVARGIIMIVMAIDHAVASWVANYHVPEIVLGGLPPGLPAFDGYPDAARHLTRVLTHICAPGFQFLAGLGMAISVSRATAAGSPQWRLSLDMVARGAVLIALEYLLMAPIYQSNFLFLVLCCIGASTILFAFLRFLPLPIISFGSFAVMLLAPLYAPTELVPPSASRYLINIWTNIAFGPSWAVMYPILPWVGCFGLGWWLGARNFSTATEPEAGRVGWLPPPPTALLGIAMIVLGILLRAFAGTFGDRLGGQHMPWTSDFWLFSKYPPSPAFLFIFLGINVVLVGLLRPIDWQAKRSPLWSIAWVFGRVALFFFIVHFWFYALSWYLFVGPATLNAVPPTQWSEYQFPLIVGYGVWLMGLILLWPVCLGYGKLRQRYRRVLRYF